MNTVKVSNFTRVAMRQDMNRLRHHQTITNGIREAYPRFSHYQSFTKRCKGVIEETLPGYTVVISVDEVRNFKPSRTVCIHVWGNGLAHSEQYVASWTEWQGDDWRVKFDEAIKRSDPTDSLERIEQEKAILAKLAKLDQVIAQARLDAQEAIESLPIPPTAVKANYRADPSYWNSLTPEHRKMFPNLY